MGHGVPGADIFEAFVHDPLKKQQLFHEVVPAGTLGLFADHFDPSFLHGRQANLLGSPRLNGQ